MKKIDVRVVSDFLCPWCYIGGVRLDRALEELKKLPNVEINVKWHTFLIESRIPQGGMDFGEYMDKRWGAPHPFWLVDVEESAVEDKIPLVWNKVAVDTFESHCCSEYVAKHYPEKQHEFHIALLKANYAENKNISLREVIGEVANSIGINGDEVAKQTEVTRKEIPQLAKKFPNVNGVPDVMFSVNGKPVFRYSGAQKTEYVINKCKQFL